MTRSNLKSSDKKRPSTFVANNRNSLMRFAKKLDDAVIPKKPEKKPLEEILKIESTVRMKAG